VLVHLKEENVWQRLFLGRSGFRVSYLRSFFFLSLVNQQAQVQLCSVAFPRYTTIITALYSLVGSHTINKYALKLHATLYILPTNSDINLFFSLLTRPLYFSLFSTFVQATHIKGFLYVHPLLICCCCLLVWLVWQVYSRPFCAIFLFVEEHINSCITWIK